MSEPQPVAFVCAMPMELAPLSKRLQLRKTTVGDVDVRRGRFEGRDVVAIVTGMGTDLATQATNRLLDVITPAHVVVVGITGAVDDDTPIGTLVLPEVVVNSETGEEFAPAPLGDGIPHGVMWTTNVITPPEHLPALRARGVVALDMETAAIAACCEARGIPWSVFRVVSDRASDGTVDDELFAMSNQDGTPNPRAVLRYVIRHPHHLPRLARMGRDARLATRAAVQAALTAVAAD